MPHSKQLARRHAFRAALEVALRRHAPHVDASLLSLGKLPRGGGGEHEDDDAGAFASYAHAAMARVGVAVDCASREELSSLWRDELAAPAALMGAFCALRAVLAAPLESLIVLDRLLFLRESLAGSGAAYALPVFDPSLSPRNTALVAVKAP